MGTLPNITQLSQSEEDFPKQFEHPQIPRNRQEIEAPGAGAGSEAPVPKATVPKKKAAAKTKQNPKAKDPQTAETGASMEKKKTRAKAKAKNKAKDEAQEDAAAGKGKKRTKPVVEEVEEEPKKPKGVFKKPAAKDTPGLLPEEPLRLRLT